MAELSVDGWQPSEDAVATQSQRLVPSVLSDTAEQCRPGIGRITMQSWSCLRISVIFGDPYAADSGRSSDESITHTV